MGNILRRRARRGLGSDATPLDAAQAEMRVGTDDGAGEAVSILLLGTSRGRSSKKRSREGLSR